jgi:hypothetical protein
MTFRSKTNQYYKCDYFFKTLMIIISIILFIVTDLIFCSSYKEIEGKINESFSNLKNEVKKIKVKKGVKNIKKIWKFFMLWGMNGDYLPPEDHDIIKFIEKNYLLFFEFVFLQAISNRLFIFLKKIDPKYKYDLYDQNTEKRVNMVKDLLSLYLNDANILNRSEVAISHNIKKQLLAFDVGAVLKENFFSRLFANNISSIFSYLMESYSNIINVLYNKNGTFGKERIIKSIYNDIVRYVDYRRSNDLRLIFCYLDKEDILNVSQVEKDFLIEHNKSYCKDQLDLCKKFQDNKVCREIKFLFSRKLSILENLIRK